MRKAVAIVGIHTGIGKTIASAVLAEALGADYWKPVQAGIDQRDAVQVSALLTNGNERVHEEAHVLTEPLSPHAAAAIDKVEVNYKTFTWPETDKTLLVETAGGVLSPMSANSTMADFVAHYEMPAVLVSMNYLGSINHTLMSIEVLRKRGINLLGIVMNGLENEQSEIFIERYSRERIIARIPFIASLDNERIAKRAMQLRPSLQAFF